ncbi:MAG TPA: flagellar assembly protein FliW [Spirochaetia bacterium]|nr:flagellar assembly protein FliW [Spirochaetales bacterium]HRY79944.1 flagellar assembly protein FliW [Spirochaetia bacterium]
MRIQTKAYGPLDVDERQVLHFPDGLLGFEKFKDYALLDAAQKPFFYLQSMDISELAFVLIDPFLFRPDYSVDADDALLSSVGIERPEDALVLSIVTVPADGSPITANLMGPLIVDRASRRGVQAVMTDPRWQTKHDVLAELAAAGK